MPGLIARTLLALAIVPVAASAQEPSPPSPPSLAALARAATPLDAGMAPRPPQPRTKDSLLNGVIIGAGLGAVAGAFGSLAIYDCLECAGFNVPLTYGVLGAAIGAGLGAGLDAMHQTAPRVRFSPLVSKKRRGLMATVRF